MGDFNSVVNSMSVYEFTADHRIRRIDVYLQMELPSPELLRGTTVWRSPVSERRSLVQPLSADEWGDDEYAAFGTLLGMPGDKVPAPVPVTPTTR